MNTHVQRPAVTSPSIPEPTCACTCRRYVVRALPIIALAGLCGCSVPPPGDVDTELAVAEVATGTLFSTQRLRARATVEADHIYRIGAALVTPEADGQVSAEVVGIVSGTPLPEPVPLAVADSFGSLLDPEAETIVVSQSEGEIVVELQFEVALTSGQPDEDLDFVRTLVGGAPHATYELLLTDLGMDDNGTSPQGAVELVVGPEGERTGELGPRDEADYFFVLVQPEITYLLTVEATRSVSVVSGYEDRFGQINFGVPTPGGLLVSADALAGVPGTSTFTATETEVMFLRVAPSDADTTPLEAIQYAVSVIETVPEEEEPPPEEEQPEPQP